MILADHIPYDIAADILSKLPSRSVLRFKTGCKTWYSLISNPEFINLHSQRQVRTPQNTKILFSTGEYSKFKIQLLDYENRSFDDSCLSRRVKFRGKTSRNNRAKIIGSSCGLVCVATHGWSGNKFTIWNPLTKEYRKLRCNVMNDDNKNYFHGLGYDSVANDFKLVLTTDRITCNIFSLKANKWKTINCTPIAFEYRYHITPAGTLATVLNGLFYWLVQPSRIYDHVFEDNAVVAFDVAAETFEKLQLPQHVKWNSTRAASLLEHRGCLCVSFETSDNKEIWMMKEYGGWVHLLTIKNPLLHNCFRLPVLCISTRNEAVFHAGFRFMRCGRKEKELEEIGVEQYVYGTILYVETLVSPNVKDEQQLPIKRKRRRRRIINV